MEGTSSLPHLHPLTCSRPTWHEPRETSTHAEEAVYLANPARCEHVNSGGSDSDSDSVLCPYIHGSSSRCTRLSRGSGRCVLAGRSGDRRTGVGQGQRRARKEWPVHAALRPLVLGASPRSRHITSLSCKTVLGS